MEFVGRVLLLLHLIGFAALFGGGLVQLRTAAPEVNGAMLYGAWASLVTGAALVALAVLEGGEIDYAQWSIKLGLTLFVVLLVAKNRKFLSIPRGLLSLIAGLSLVSAGVSVLWP